MVTGTWDAPGSAQLAKVSHANEQSSQALLRAGFVLTASHELTYLILMRAPLWEALF